MAKGAAVIWEKATDEFSNYLRNMPVSNRDFEASIAKPEIRIKDGFAQLPAFSFCATLGDGAPAGDALVRYTVHARLLWPHSFDDYRLSAMQLAEIFNKMYEEGGKPHDRVLIGVTDMDIERNDHPRFGSGVDRLLNPATLPGFAALLADKGAPPLNITLAVSGFERIFARFCALSRGEGSGFVGALPWWNHSSAFAAAWDPKVMKPLLKDVIDRRPHLLTLIQNDFVLRGPPRRLVVTPIIPCGFLNAYSRPVNYDLMFDEWLLADPAECFLRDEGDEPTVVPFGTCDVFLTAIAGFNTPMQLTAEDTRLMRRAA